MVHGSTHSVGDDRARNRLTSVDNGSNGGRGSLWKVHGDFPAVMQRNTFTDMQETPPASQRARTLRRKRTDGDTPVSDEIAEAATSDETQPMVEATIETPMVDDSAPPSQLTRINEVGGAVPGSQDSELTTRTHGLHISDPVPVEPPLAQHTARLSDEQPKGRRRRCEEVSSVV